MMIIGVLVVIELSANAALFVLGNWKHIYYNPATFKLTKTGKAALRELLDDKPQHIRLDPILGWAPKASEAIRFVDPDSQPKTETINAQGIRGKRIYSVRPESGILRIAAFGDSYTFGSTASDEECWTEVMSSSDERVEVLNFGVGGYGVDQAFLRYQEEGVRFNPHIVLIGYMTENIARHVNVFRPFYTHFQTMPASKPRFIVAGNALRLLANPLSTPRDYEALLQQETTYLPMLGRHDYFYQQSCRPSALDFFRSVRLLKLIRQTIHRKCAIGSLYRNDYYNKASEAFEVTVKLLEEFAQTVDRNGATPILVVFPHRKDVDHYVRNQRKCYQPLLDRLRPDELRIVDLIEPFQRAARFHSVADVFDSEGGGHYSPLGNEIVAKHLLRYLRTEELLDDSTSETRKR